MNLKIRFNLVFQVLLAAFILQCCQPREAEKPKVVYVNSYHRGHPSSDEIMDEVVKAFPVDSFELHTYIMDSKRNTSKAYIEKKAALLFDSISALQPNVVIVSDDNAVKYLVQPYFPNTELPLVFCGVNWSDKEYDLKSVKVSGMLEILPLADVLLAMKTWYPSINNLLVLNENTTTSRKEKLLLDSLFNRVGFTATHELVDDFEHWKTKFEEGNSVYDIIYVNTNGGIKAWNREEAIDFVHEHISVPVITCEDFMMPYAVVGYTKVAKEQGIWAAASAKRILKGERPEDIPVTNNKESAIWFNPGLAEKINFQPDTSFLEKAKRINIRH